MDFVNKFTRVNFVYETAYMWRAHCYVGSSTTTCAKVEEKTYARGESSVKGGTEKQNDIRGRVMEREGDKSISDAHVFTCHIHATKGSVLISSHGQAGSTTIAFAGTTTFRDRLYLIPKRNVSSIPITTIGTRVQRDSIERESHCCTGGFICRQSIVIREYICSNR